MYFKYLGGDILPDVSLYWLVHRLLAQKFSWGTFRHSSVTLRPIKTQEGWILRMDPLKRRFYGFLIDLDSIPMFLKRWAGTIKGKASCIATEVPPAFLVPGLWPQHPDFPLGKESTGNFSESREFCREQAHCNFVTCAWNVCSKRTHLFDNFVTFQVQ